MNRIPVEQSTGAHDENVRKIDEQICALLQQRKKCLKNASNSPLETDITDWAKKYHLYEEYVSALFSFIANDELFKPKIEPKEFQKHIPVLQTIAHEEKNYTITHIRQFTNASVLYLYVDWYEEEDDPLERIRRDRDRIIHFLLHISEDYECRSDRSGGSTGNYCYQYVITPALPDDLSDLQFTFKEVTGAFPEHETGVELTFRA